MAGCALILGGTSPMARACAEALAAEGWRIFLASRSAEACERTAADLRIRFGAGAGAGRFDAADPSSHAAFLQEAVDWLGGLDALVVAVGDLGADPATLDPGAAQALFQANFTGPCSIVALAASRMAAQGRGAILGVGSPAGDRGRGSNFVYGAAKGGFALFLQGLRNALRGRGVRVVTFKPGFVDTAMTYGTRDGLLVASPGAAGRAMARALSGGRDVVYFPWFWRWIMAVIKAIPESVFKRLGL